jgi:hypothetical protein
MWQKIDYLKRAAITLGLSSDETKELSNRMYGHFKKHGIKKDEIIKSFFILQHIYYRKEQIKLKTTAPLLGFKNKGIKIYKGDIVKFFDAGLSSHEINKRLSVKKDAPSLSTIKRYINTLKAWRLENGAA